MLCCIVSSCKCCYCYCGPSVGVLPNSPSCSQRQRQQQHLDNRDVYILCTVHLTRLLLTDFTDQVGRLGGISQLIKWIIQKKNYLFLFVIFIIEPSRVIAMRYTCALLLQQHTSVVYVGHSSAPLLASVLFDTERLPDNHRSSSELAGMSTAANKASRGYRSSSGSLLPSPPLLLLLLLLFAAAFL